MKKGASAPFFFMLENILVASELRIARIWIAEVQIGGVNAVH
jgi:hypothetical protein